MRLGCAATAGSPPGCSRSARRLMRSWDCRDTHEINGLQRLRDLIVSKVRSYSTHDKPHSTLTDL